jgi:hypothetical protein
MTSTDTNLRFGTNVALRVGIAATLAISGLEHAYLYIHGYSHIPTVGTGFLVQASVFLAVAVLVLVGGPDWLVWASGLLALGALGAFAMSRSVGLFGFTETGWAPSPHAAVTVAAEVITLALAVLWVLRRRSGALRLRSRRAASG